MRETARRWVLPALVTIMLLGTLYACQEQPQAHGQEEGAVVQATSAIYMPVVAYQPQTDGCVAAAEAADGCQPQDQMFLCYPELNGATLVWGAQNTFTVSNPTGSEVVAKFLFRPGKNFKINFALWGRTTNGAPEWSIWMGDDVWTGWWPVANAERGARLWYQRDTRFEVKLKPGESAFFNLGEIPADKMTPENTPTSTPTLVPTNTPVPPTATSTPTRTPFPTATSTPVPHATATSTPGVPTATATTWPANPELQPAAQQGSYVVRGGSWPLNPYFQLRWELPANVKPTLLGAPIQMELWNSGTVTETVKVFLQPGPGYVANQAWWMRDVHGSTSQKSIWLGDNNWTGWEPVGDGSHGARFWAAPRETRFELRLAPGAVIRLTLGEIPADCGQASRPWCRVD